MLRGRHVFKNHEFCKVFCVTGYSILPRLFGLSNRYGAFCINTSRRKAAGIIFGPGGYPDENRTFSMESITSFPSSLNFLFGHWQMIVEFILCSLAFAGQACSCFSWNSPCLSPPPLWLWMSFPCDQVTLWDVFKAYTYLVFNESDRCPLNCYKWNNLALGCVFADYCIERK